MAFCGVLRNAWSVHPPHITRSSPSQHNNPAVDIWGFPEEQDHFLPRNGQSLYEGSAIDRKLRTTINPCRPVSARLNNQNIPIPEWARSRSCCHRPASPDRYADASISSQLIPGRGSAPCDPVPHSHMKLIPPISCQRSIEIRALPSSFQRQVLM